METASLSLESQSKGSYGDDYSRHLLEQYKLYVDLADRISARRTLANSFFLGANTALITAISVMLSEGLLESIYVIATVLAASLLLCYVWWRILVSYRRLNSGKFQVIHLLEEKLPVAPYAAEWTILGMGKNAKLYRSLTRVETFVPGCFALLYLILAASNC